MKALLAPTLRMDTATATSDLALLLARLGLGGVLMAHGWQKLDEQGVSGTAAGFEGMGIPLPGLAAYFATYVEDRKSVV